MILSDSFKKAQHSSEKQNKFNEDKILRNKNRMETAKKGKIKPSTGKQYGKPLKWFFLGKHPLQK